MDKADDGDLDDLIDDPDLAEDVDPADDVEDESDLLALEQDAKPADAPDDAPGPAARAPAARRPAAANVDFNDKTLIEFEQENPKRAGTRARAEYEAYKLATTVGEARRLGASKGHVRYDVVRGFAKLTAVPAII
eukprot:445620-Heterocapsa_arctica.AAC.1